MLFSLNPYNVCVYLPIIFKKGWQKFLQKKKLRLLCPEMVGNFLKGRDKIFHLKIK